MPDPWDNPELPSEADENIDLVYNGVGRVTSEWEGIEVGFSRIYSFFSQSPDEYAAFAKYGEGNIFQTRMNALVAIGDAYFINHRNQELEGEFHRLSTLASDYSKRRNDIAHGIVGPIQYYEWFASKTQIKPKTNYWALLPAYHKLSKPILNNPPRYVYYSKSLRVVEKGINSLYGEIAQYREQLRGLTVKS